MKATHSRWIATLALVCTATLAVGNAHAYGQCRAPRQPGCLSMMNFAKDEFTIRACRSEVDAYRQLVDSYIRCMVDEVAAERTDQLRNVDKARERIDCYEQGRSVCF